MKLRVAASTEGTISATRPRDRAVQAVDLDFDLFTDPDEAQARLVDRGLQTQVAFALQGEQRRSRRGQAAGIGFALGDQAGEGRGERGVAEGHTRGGELGFGLAAARLDLPALRDGHLERRLGALEPGLRLIDSCCETDALASRSSKRLWVTRASSRLALAAAMAFSVSAMALSASAQAASARRRFASRSPRSNTMSVWPAVTRSPAWTRTSRMLAAIFAAMAAV